MLIKNELRKLYKSIRAGVSPDEKQLFDSRILSNLFNTDFFRSSGLILTYSSYSSEPDTSELIRYSLSLGKSVAVPFWQNGRMDFYFINSPDDLTKIISGISSVDISRSHPVTDFSGCLCIVPGLSFDISGGRLGYGGGYYDRFLSEHPGVFSAGICYERCLCRSSLPLEAHDIRVKTVITDNSVIQSTGGFTYG